MKTKKTNERKVFLDSVVPLHAAQGLTMEGLMVNAALPEHRAEKMTLHFALEMPAEALAKLEAKVAKGEVVSPAELKKNYGPAKGSAEKLEAWLKREGFTILPVPHDGSSVYAEAPASQIEKSLAVTMARVSKDGIAYTAAQNAPSLPVAVGESVQAIIGLQPYRKVLKHIRFIAPKGDNRLSLTPDAAAGAVQPSPNIANKPPYLVAEMCGAYNATGLKLTGHGQTIAILIDTVPKDSDLTAFWKANNLPCTLQQIQKINVTGHALPAPEGEETLDVSWSSGFAPGATIRIYATSSLSFVNLDMALDRIIADMNAIPSMRQLSISLGIGEQDLGSGEINVEHQKFVKLAAAGVNVFVSSGDSGSNPNGKLQAEYEAADACVIAVGGTSLKLNPTGTVASETGWTSGGGGVSKYMPRPAWQKARNVPAGTTRLVPDVAAGADPNEGAYLVLQGKVIQIGGTSWSAPMWAGICALLNEARKNAGKAALSFLDPLLYPLDGTACFRDITVGCNGAYHCGVGYDLVTGLGAPNVAQLVQALTKLP